jgi:hypothetical protein
MTRDAEIASSSRVALLVGSACALVSARASRRLGVLGVVRTTIPASQNKKRDEVRRGRKSLDQYRGLVAKALVSDRFTLDEFPVLSQLPVVEQWAATNPRQLCARGRALQALLRQAVADVIAEAGDLDDVAVGRLVEYLRLRYQEGRPVKAIAERWSCSTVQVWRSAGRRALDLVTERFLDRARLKSEPVPSVAHLKVVGRSG